MEEQINQRIAWIEKRVKLPELAKEYIAFQMMQFAKYYHIQQVKSVDLADVVGRSEQLVDFYLWHRNKEPKTEVNLRKAKEYVEMYLKDN